MADPTAVGRIRRHAVEIGGSVYLPVALPQRLEALFGIVVQMASGIDVPQQAYVDAMLGLYELNRVDLLRDVFVLPGRASIRVAVEDVPFGAEGAHLLIFGRYLNPSHPTRYPSEKADRVSSSLLWRRPCRVAMSSWLWACRRSQAA